MQSSVNKSESRTFFGHPYPLGSLFFTEMWERFSFYGIRPLLILFMAATVYDGGTVWRVRTRRRSSAFSPAACTGGTAGRLAGGQLARPTQGRLVRFYPDRPRPPVDRPVRGDGHQPVLHRPDVHRARFRPVQDLYLGDGRHAVQERRCAPRRRFLAVLHGHQHRFVHRPVDLRLADQVTRLALGLRHRRYRDAGGAGDFPGVRRTGDETL